MRRSTHRWLVGIVGLAAAVVVALPLGAQVNPANQPVVNRVGASSLDLGALQRMGPGGDLERAVQTAGMNATISCTPLCSECHWLDSYNAADTYDAGVPGSELINTITTTYALTNGTIYLITISGTMTFWGNSYWTSPIGNPESQPMFPSPGVPIGDQGYVGCDWEYLFGYPRDDHPNLNTTLAAGAAHLVSAGISLDNGVTFQDLTPVNGQVYSADHVYRYLVWGQGKNAKFRVSDKGPHSDNYGRYWICVQAVTLCGSAAPPS
jgi:hypothetical protein